MFSGAMPGSFIGVIELLRHRARLINHGGILRFVTVYCAYEALTSFWLLILVTHH